MENVELMKLSDSPFGESISAQTIANTVNFVRRNKDALITVVYPYFPLSGNHTVRMLRLSRKECETGMNGMFVQVAEKLRPHSRVDLEHPEPSEDYRKALLDLYRMVEEAHRDGVATADNTTVFLSYILFRYWQCLDVVDPDLAEPNILRIDIDKDGYISNLLGRVEVDLIN